MSSCSQVCCRSLELLADRQRSWLIQLAVHERRVAILHTGRFTSPAVHRRPASHRRLSLRRSALQVVSETHSRPTTRSTTCCCFRTERWLSPRHPDGRQGEVGHRYRILGYCWRLMQRDGRAWTIERHAVRRQAVPAVRCRRLCKNGTAATILRYNQNSPRSWRCSGEWTVDSAGRLRF